MYRTVENVMCGLMFAKKKTHAHIRKSTVRNENGRRLVKRMTDESTPIGKKACDYHSSVYIRTNVTEHSTTTA